MITARTITVMLGGPSAEREVSIRSGQAVAKALRERGHIVHELDPKPGAWTLPQGTDVVFLALHGTFGEDGTVQAELDRAGVPYTGCNAESSRVAFDKVLTKQRCLDAGVPTAEFHVISRRGAQPPKNLIYPCVLKPVRQGSSVGLRFVYSPDEWAEGLDFALKYDSEILVEPRILGRETTVGILDGEALPVVEVRPKAGAYDYRNKYTAGATEYFCPADFPPEITALIQAAGLGAFNAIGGGDYGRVDVMVTERGEPIVLEVNTLPGMTETSLLPKAAAAAGLDYGELCQKMIDLAMARSAVKA